MNDTIMNGLNMYLLTFISFIIRKSAFWQFANCHSGTINEFIILGDSVYLYLIHNTTTYKHHLCSLMLHICFWHFKCLSNAPT